MNGSDRFTIRWADNAIEGKWLQVSVLPTSRTGLSSADIFYFGNAIGDSGNSTVDARVSIIDENAARQNHKTIPNFAEMDDPYDFNRDRRVSVIDENISRNNFTTVATALRLIALP